MQSASLPLKAVRQSDQRFAVWLEQIRGRIRCSDGDHSESGEKIAAPQSLEARMHFGSFTLGIAHIQPIAALIAGVLILIVPRLLNYIVAVFLILTGLLGLGILH